MNAGSMPLNRLTFPSSFQQLAMFGRQRLLLLMPHFCPSVSTFVQDPAPLSTAAWAAAAHAGRPEAVYQTGPFAPFCLMRTPFCSSFRFGIGGGGCCCCWPQNLSRFEHSRAGALLLVSTGHVPALFSPVAMLDSVVLSRMLLCEARWP